MLAEIGSTDYSHTTMERKQDIHMASWASQEYLIKVLRPLSDLIENPVQKHILPRFVQILIKII